LHSARSGERPGRLPLLVEICGPDMVEAFKRYRGQNSRPGVITNNCCPPTRTPAGAARSIYIADGDGTVRSRYRIGKENRLRKPDRRPIYQMMVDALHVDPKRLRSYLDRSRRFTLEAAREMGIMTTIKVPNAQPGAIAELEKGDGIGSCARRRDCTYNSTMSKSTLGRAAFRTHPIRLEFSPPGCPEQAFVRCAGCFVIDVAASRQLPGFVGSHSFDSRSCMVRGRDGFTSVVGRFHECQRGAGPPPAPPRQQLHSRKQHRAAIVAASTVVTSAVVFSASALGHGMPARRFCRPTSGPRRLPPH